MAACKPMPLSVPMQRRVGRQLRGLDDVGENEVILSPHRSMNACAKLFDLKAHGLYRKLEALYGLTLTRLCDAFPTSLKMGELGRHDT
jgi:hypothetical protein